MKRLIIITLLLAAATCMAAGVQYYSYPTATVFHDTDRMLIYQNASGSKNLTGAGLKSVAYQTAWDHQSVKVFNTYMTSAQEYNYINAMRDRYGRVTWLQWENGYWFNGRPGYNHVYVYPFNNMTNVSRTTPLVVGGRWLTRGFVGKNITIPGGPSFTVQALNYKGKINGLPYFSTISDTADQTVLDAFFWGTPTVGTLSPNTTYTIRSALAQVWNSNAGQLHGIGDNPCTYQFTNTSSAKVMTNYSAVLCRSTFRTGS